VAAIGRNVVLIDFDRRQRIWTAHPFSHPASAAFSADGSILAVKNTSGLIVVLSTETGAVIRNYHNDADGEGSNITYSPYGDLLIDGSWSGLFTIREIFSGRTAA
jgi:WD40 repeat protein